MSYKIEKAKFLNNKINIDNLDFKTNNDGVTQVLVTNQNDKKTIARIFKGKEQVVDGRFLIDGLDLVNPKFVKDRSKFIYTDKYIERFIPAKLILVFSSLFNPLFTRNARIEHLRTKFNYLNYKSSKNNITEVKLKSNLEKTIEKFIDDEFEKQDKTSSAFEKQIEKFNIKKSDEIFGEVNNILKVVSNSYFNEKTRLESYKLSLTFLQVMWDNIYEFDNLRNSCTCEYNAKKSSNRSIRKLKHDLNYNQTKYVVKKQLKYIGIKITEYRTLIYRQTKLVGQLKKQFDFELEKHKKNILKNKKTEISAVDKSIAKWGKVINDQQDIFSKHQQEYFFKTIKEEAGLVSKELIVYIHKYHQKVLSKSVKIGTKDEFKKKKKWYKEKIVSVYVQALRYNIKQMEDLGIKMEWFLKATFKLSSLNILFVKIIGAINMNKKNIFLMDFVHLLSPGAFKRLMITIEKIMETEKDITFTIVDSRVNKLPYLDKDIYYFDKNTFVPKTLDKMIDAEPTYFKVDVFANKNTFKYTYDKNVINIYDKKYKYKNKDLKPSGIAFVNPFKMKYESTGDYDIDHRITIISDIKRATNFNDSNMYYCRDEKGNKFYFYDNENKRLVNKNRAIITFDLNSVSEYI